MTTFSYAERAARLLRAARARIRPHRSATSGETIDLLGAAITAAASRRRYRRISTAAGAGTVAVAAAVLMVSGPWSSPKPADRPGGERPFAVRPRLVTGGQSAGSMTTATGGGSAARSGARLEPGRTAAERRAPGHLDGGGRHGDRSAASLRSEAVARRYGALDATRKWRRLGARRQADHRRAIRDPDARRRGGGARHALSRRARSADRRLWPRHTDARRGRRGRRRGPLAAG